MGKGSSCYHLWEEEYGDIMNLIIQLLEGQMPKGPQRASPSARATSSSLEHPHRANWVERISSNRAAFKNPRPNRQDKKNSLISLFCWSSSDASLIFTSMEKCYVLILDVADIKTFLLFTHNLLYWNLWFMQLFCFPGFFLNLVFF